MPPPKRPPDFLLELPPKRPPLLLLELLLPNNFYRAEKMSIYNKSAYENMDDGVSLGSLDTVDYDKKSPTTIKFFKKVQNKMHYAVSHQTAAEIIYNRADSEKEHMGLTSWKNSPNGKILETDVVIAKNYLSKEELESLELIVSAFLDLAENRAKRHIPMTMEDWSTRIDKFLLADDLDILKDAGKISHEIACDKALTEFEKYRIKQDKLYKSDFDLLLEESINTKGGN